MDQRSPSFLSRASRSLVAWTLRVVLALAGLVFMLSLLVFGLVAGVLLVVWSLLHGRRPVLRGMPGANWRGFQRPAPRGDVVDVEVREVPDARKPGPG